MKKAKPLVSIIVVNHNGKRLLKKCLDSLGRLDYPAQKTEIIVVDNCSQDDSPAYIQSHYPRIKLIKNNVNNYCRANNLGIKHAKGKFIALINNDVKVAKDWLRNLVEFIQQNSAIGAVTSKILFPDGTLQGTGHYELPNYYWTDRGFKEDDKKQYNKIEQVPSISHCATLYRKKCLQDVGLLDEDFNMYMEDVDISIRAKQKGWPLFYLPTSIAYHSFHGTANDDLALFYCERNRLLLIAKHHPEKLAQALLGKGYFTVLGKRNDLIQVLSDTLNKINKHHNSQTLNKLLPDIFDSLNKILNLEKDCLIKQRESLRDSLFRKDQQLSQKDQQLSQKDQQLSQKGQQLSQKDQQLSQKDQQLSQQGQQLNSLLHQIQDRDNQLQQLRNEIHRICNTKTYKYIDRPFWKVLAILELILKPFIRRGKDRCRS